MSDTTIVQGHPHVDPRQPRAGTRCDTNPPVFVWKPRGENGGKETSFGLKVCRDRGMRRVVLQVRGLVDPMYLPTEALPAGRYFWAWSAGGKWSEVFEFVIPASCVKVEVPEVAKWLERLPQGHPRLYVRPEQVEALRESRTGEREESWRGLKAQADAELAKDHEYPEPPFLSDWSVEYQKTYDLWLKILRETRMFVTGAQTLALAYLASGDRRYGEAACRRLDSVARWDPDGSSHIVHNDEAHMSVMWWGPAACDWVWDVFTPEQRRRVIAHFRRRGQITFEHMHARGGYGVTDFRSHSGREIVFLANLAMVFYRHIPEAATWLRWLRPVLCGIWPIWAGADGAWAEGIMYGFAYVNIMTTFASALKEGCGVDLYRRPFWANHGIWRQWCHMPYAQWVGFGDQSYVKNWNGVWNEGAALAEILYRQTGRAELGMYAGQMRRLTERGPERPPVNAQLYLIPKAEVIGAGRSVREARGRQELMRVFPAAGWAAIRTDLEDGKKDIAMIFRSSPFGAISHSHANQNDLILHVGGQVMAMPSGYYPGYGSPHHTHWTWQTHAHNCVTFSNIGQLVESYESTGKILYAFEDDLVCAVGGNGDAAYRLAASRCRRHIVFLKRQRALVVVDEFVAAEGVNTALQWNLHSWGRFAVDEKVRQFVLKRGGSSLQGTVMYHRDGFFSLSKGWDPSPPAGKGDYPMQHHLRFSTTALERRLNFGVVLACGLPGKGRAVAKVRTSVEGELEEARVGDARVVLHPGGRAIGARGVKNDIVLWVRVGGRSYQVGTEGVSPGK